MCFPRIAHRYYFVILLISICHLFNNVVAAAISINANLDAELKKQTNMLLDATAVHSMKRNDRGDDEGKQLLIQMKEKLQSEDDELMKPNMVNFLIGILCKKVKNDEKSSANERDEEGFVGKSTKLMLEICNGDENKLTHDLAKFGDEMADLMRDYMKLSEQEKTEMLAKIGEEAARIDEEIAQKKGKQTRKREILKLEGEIWEEMEKRGKGIEMAENDENEKGIKEKVKGKHETGIKLDEERKKHWSATKLVRLFAKWHRIFFGIGNGEEENSPAAKLLKKWTEQKKANEIKHQKQQKIVAQVGNQHHAFRQAWAAHHPNHHPSSFSSSSSLLAVHRRRKRQQDQGGSMFAPFILGMLLLFFINPQLCCFAFCVLTFFGFVLGLFSGGSGAGYRGEFGEGWGG